MAITERALCPVMVRRDDELTLLEDALLSAFRGEGQVVVLAGDAGVGKTRLATETAHRAAKIGGTVLSGGCSEADLALPYLPFVEAIGNWLASTDPASVVERLGPAAAELAQLFPQLGAASGGQGTDPSQAKLRLFEAVLSLLRIAAGEKGLLFIVEDLHWADAASRELLDYMTRRLRGARIMVLATYRLDEMHRKHPLLPIVQGWRRSRLAEIIELTPLPLDGVAEMIAAIFDYNEVSPEFRDYLHERSEGNPFVLEEMLKEAIDRGDIYRTATRWERKAIEELGIPRSVADSILLRVERLDPDHAEVLSTASVLGPSFDYPTLVTLTGMPKNVVQAALQACVLQQLLVEEAQGRYRFRHALTREAVYEDLISPRRLELHSRAADALRANPDTPPVDLARHLLAAQRWSEAVPVCRQAARDAMARRAFQEAADLAERALAHMDDELERARTLGFIGEAACGAVDLPRAEGALERAMEVLERRGEDDEAAPLHLLLGRVRWLQSRPDEAARHYERAREVLERAGPSRDLAVAYIRLAGLAQFNFEGEAAVARATRAIEVAEAFGDDSSRVWAYLFLGGGYLSSDRFVEGLQWMRRAVEESIALGLQDVATNAVHNTVVMFEDVGLLDEASALLARYSEIAPSPFITFSRSFLGGVLELGRGYIQAALPLLEEAHRFASDGAWPAWEGWAQQWVVYALAHADRVDEARRMLRISDSPDIEKQELMQDLHSGLVVTLSADDVDEALRLARITTANADVFASLGYLCLLATEAFCRAGVPDEATPLTERSIIQDAPVHAGGVLGARGLLALNTGRLEDAVESLQASLQEFDAADFLIFAWRVRRALARALHRAGRIDDARDVVQTALSQATERGSALDRRLALELANELGVELQDVAAPSQPAEPVKAVETAERIVTVMFADVRGYTAMTRREAPADMHERMTTFYRWARAEIEKRDGMVDRYAGDAVMASWNTTVSTLEHTTRAVETAISLQDKASLMDLPVGVGIAVGSALVGRMTGSENVDVIGETTNLAARLQAQASPGEILLSPEAYRRAKQWVDDRDYVVEDRLLTLKGYDDPVPAVALKHS
jgi:class 3 adenylate cyclase